MVLSSHFSFSASRLAKPEDWTSQHMQPPMHKAVASVAICSHDPAVLENWSDTVGVLAMNTFVEVL